MSFNCSTRFSPSMFSEVDEHELLMRCTGAPNVSSYHTARGSRDILAQEEEINDAQTQAPRDRYCKDVTDVEEDVEIEDEKSEVDHKKADTTEYPIQDLLTARRYKE